MTVAPAGPAALADALALLYGPGADEDVGHAFQRVARGDLDPNDILVARRDEVPVGAAFASRLPGGVAVMWPPRAVGDDRAVEDVLAAAALAHVAGAKAVQAILPAAEAGRAGPLLRAGFRHVTRVWQMAGPLVATRRRSASRPTPGDVTRSAGASRLTAVPYPAGDPAAFHAALVRAHDDSLDVPELNGLLIPDEVLAGYRDAAPDPASWWLASADGRPAGVLILNGDEVVFLGVVPEHRRRGVGRYLLDLALARAPALTLIVDVRNSPAYQLYRSAGLGVVGAREVFLRFPPPAAGITGPAGRRS